MKQSEFAALDELADDADDKVEEWLQSDSLSSLRAALEKAIGSLQGGITGRQENPAIGCGQDFAIGGSDGVWRGAGGESGVAHLFFNTKVSIA